MAVARELAYSSFELVEGRIVHDPDLMRRRAYETALFLAVTEGTARDRLREVRLARALEDQGIDVAVDASLEDLQSAASPRLEVLSAPVESMPSSFDEIDGLRAATYFIRMFEGLETTAYQDQVGVWTIGFGTTGDWISPGTTITTAEASRFLTDYIRDDWQGLRSQLDAEVPAQEQAALLSLSYNVGLPRLAESTLLRELNAGNEASAAEHFLDWNKARIDGELVVLPGLDRRRHAERALFSLEASPMVAADVIMRHFSFHERQQILDNGLALLGYGEVAPANTLPRRITQEEARSRLVAQLERVRADVSNALDRVVDPLQLEALTVLAYTIGMERFERLPVLSYINEGNTQAALASIGYWDLSSRGAGGVDIENYAELRADSAVLFVLGYRI